VSALGRGEPGCGLIEFAVSSQPYDVDYVPAGGTRATTNFANLARDPATRRRNIATLMELIDSDLNLLLCGDPVASRYRIELDIVTVTARFADGADFVPMTEVMRAHVVDSRSGERFRGPTGLNFSSYLRDYDFRVVLPDLRERAQSLDDFGQLHGLLTRMQFGAGAVVPEPLTVAISISQNADYRATDVVHPILGREYTAVQDSITDGYFRHMGLAAQYFRPVHLPAPIAFYSDGSLTDRDDIYLAALVAVMGTFQRIYRPEIYLSATPFSDTPGSVSRASLSNADHSAPPIAYDRQERELLSDYQARQFDERVVKAYPGVVEQLRELARRS